MILNKEILQFIKKNITPLTIKNIIEHSSKSNYSHLEFTINDEEEFYVFSVSTKLFPEIFVYIVDYSHEITILHKNVKAIISHAKWFNGALSSFSFDASKI